MRDVPVQFGKAIKKRRLEVGISQEELAERASLHRTYVSDVERGNRNISLINIFKLLAGLEIEAREFFAKYFKGR